ncbi:MAG: LysR family transcriptional regulator [Clostridiaceae bacterium]
MLDPKIKTFLKVAELKHFTKAAQALNLTQPAVSQQIRRLEEYYGTRLLEASVKGVRLTPEGVALMRYAQFQLANEEQLFDQFKKLEKPLRIGATLSIADYYLSQLVGPFMVHNKEAISITVKNTQVILDMLLRNELDCAFVEGLFDKSVFSYEEFIETKFVAVARFDHQLAKKIASLNEVQCYPLILREIGSGTREIYENFLYQHNDSIQSAGQIYEVSSFGLIKQLLAQTDGVSFMYEEVAKKEVQEGTLTILEIEDLKIQRPLYYIYPRNGIDRAKHAEFYRKLMERS